MNQGYWTIAHLRGAPIRLHWTLPLGALAMSRFAFVPAFWLGFALLIAIHELGHALCVLRFGLGLTEIAIHGAGGYCRHQRSGSPLQEAIVAWGGVLAQLALLLACVLALQLLGAPTSRHVAQLVHVFTTTNLLIIGFNLLPIEPLDGAKAWPLIPLLWRRLRRRAPTVADTLRDLEQLDTPADAPRDHTDRTDRIVRDLISRTTQSKRDR
ncbi:MAG TPA: hypothetical protein VIW29_12900 [Polyangiaceae bacterium]